MRKPKCIGRQVLGHWLHCCCWRSPLIIRIANNVCLFSFVGLRASIAHTVHCMQLYTDTFILIKYFVRRAICRKWHSYTNLVVADAFECMCMCALSIAVFFCSVLFALCSSAKCLAFAWMWKICFYGASFSKRVSTFATKAILLTHSIKGRAAALAIEFCCHTLFLSFCLFIK